VGGTLGPSDLELLRTARRAVLATISPDGRPRLVPICYWLAPDPDASGHRVLYSPLDEKPKSADPHRLARVRDIEARPRVGLLVDRWDEDWDKLGWLRVDGTAAIIEADGESAAAAIAGLRDRYPQYRNQDLEHRPLIRVAVDRVVRWRAA
jgi:PPOX class probable F420-dependent enzyme